MSLYVTEMLLANNPDMDVKEAMQKAKQIHEIVIQEYDRQYEEREKAFRDIEKNDSIICESKAKLNSLKEEEKKLNEEDKEECSRANGRTSNIAAIVETHAIYNQLYQTRTKIDKLNDEIHDRKRFLMREYDKHN
jgi:hypothetical protein